MPRIRKKEKNVTVIVLAIALLAVGFFAYRYFFATVSVLDYIQIKGVHIGTVEHDWLQGPFGSSIWGCRTSWNQDIMRGVDDTRFPENEYKVDEENKLKAWFFDPEDPIRCAPNLGVVVQLISSERLYGSIMQYRYKIAAIVSGSDIIGGLPAAEKENYYKDTYFILTIEPPYVIDNCVIDGKACELIYDKTGAVRLIIPITAQAPGDNPLVLPFVGTIYQWLIHATGGKGISKVYGVLFSIDLSKYVGTARTTLFAPTISMTEGTSIIYSTITQYKTLTVFKPVTTTLYITEFQKLTTTVIAGKTVTTTVPVTYTEEIKVSGYKTIVETVTVTGTETKTILVTTTVEVGGGGIGNIEELVKMAIIAGVIMMALAVAVVGIRAFRPTAQARVRGGKKRGKI
jgi:hypothetical protein